MAKANLLSKEANGNQIQGKTFPECFSSTKSYQSHLFFLEVYNLSAAFHLHLKQSKHGKWNSQNCSIVQNTDSKSVNKHEFISGTNWVSLKNCTFIDELCPNFWS